MLSINDIFQPGTVLSSEAETFHTHDILIKLIPNLVERPHFGFVIRDDVVGGQPAAARVLVEVVAGVGALVHGR